MVKTSHKACYFLRKTCVFAVDLLWKIIMALCMKLREAGLVYINKTLLFVYAYCGFSVIHAYIYMSIFMAKVFLFHSDVIILMCKFLQLASYPIKKLSATDSADCILWSLFKLESHTEPYTKIVLFQAANTA